MIDCNLACGTRPLGPTSRSVTQGVSGMAGWLRMLRAAIGVSLDLR